MVVKTSWKEMSLELKQLVALTSGTSSASANVMSAHCQIPSAHGEHDRLPTRSELRPTDPTDGRTDGTRTL